MPVLHLTKTRLSFDLFVLQVPAATVCAPCALGKTSQPSGLSKLFKTVVVIIIIAITRLLLTPSYLLWVEQTKASLDFALRFRRSDPYFTLLPCLKLTMTFKPEGLFQVFVLNHWWL
jgi:hypothetical protein